jgi:hypothetical protein
MSRRRCTVKPFNLSGIWYLAKKVSEEFRHLDGRGVVKVSTRIRVVEDPRAVLARQVVEKLNDELWAYWLDLKAGRDVDGKKRLDDARENARRFGFHYEEGEKLFGAGKANLEKAVEILERIEKLGSLSVEERSKARPALLARSRPRTPVSWCRRWWTSTRRFLRREI